MRNTYEVNGENGGSRPMSSAKHFWLSFLAVVTGVPVSLAIFSVVMFVVGLVFVMLISLATFWARQ